MKGRVHLASGILLSAGVIIGAEYYGHPIASYNVVPLAASCMLGSVFPDIDNSKSLIGRPMFILRWWQSTQSHREKITHTPLFLAISLLILLLKYNGIDKQAIVVGWTLGYLMHLFLDTCTSGGIKWNPFGEPVSFLDIRSGAITEFVLMALLCIPVAQITINLLGRTAMI